MTAGRQLAWDRGTDWTGLLLLIVPVAPLKNDPDMLFRQVRMHVANDVVLSDTVTVGLCPAVALSEKDAAKVVFRALVAAAMEAGHLFAPRAVFGCVVVGAAGEEARGMAEALAASRLIGRLPVHFYAEQEAERAPDTVGAIASRAGTMIEAFERWPDFAIDEERFYAQLSRLSRPPATAAQQPGAPRPESREPLLAPLWQGITRLGRRPRQPGEAKLLDGVATRGDSVSMVYLILGPDSEIPAHAVRQRRTAVAAELDRAFADLHRTSTTGSHTSFQIAVFTADRDLCRIGPPLPAGHLTADKLPKVVSGGFDFIACIRALIQELRRETAALSGRGLARAKTRVVFLSTMAPLADTESLEHLQHLCEQADVAWLSFGVTEGLMSPEFVQAGALLLDDHPQVAGELFAKLEDGQPAG